MNQQGVFSFSIHCLVLQIFTVVNMQIVCDVIFLCVLNTRKIIYKTRNILETNNKNLTFKLYKLATFRTAFEHYAR